MFLNFCRIRELYLCNPGNFKTLGSLHIIYIYVYTHIHTCILKHLFNDRARSLKFYHNRNLVLEDTPWIKVAR